MSYLFTAAACATLRKRKPHVFDSRKRKKVLYESEAHKDFVTKERVLARSVKCQVKAKCVLVYLFTFLLSCHLCYVFAYFVYDSYTNNN